MFSEAFLYRGSQHLLTKINLKQYTIHHDSQYANLLISSSRLFWKIYCTENFLISNYLLLSCSAGHYRQLLDKCNIHPILLRPFFFFFFFGVNYSCSFSCYVYLCTSPVNYIIKILMMWKFVIYYLYCLFLVPWPSQLERKLDIPYCVLQCNQ